MSKKIFLLTDYKGVFGSKWGGYPYRAGMDLNILLELFEKANLNPVIKNFSEAVNEDIIKKGDYVVYTSTEDTDFLYKSFIEDVIHYLELTGAKVIPSYLFLKATNNKVFMELLRKKFDLDPSNDLSASVFGTFEEAQKNYHNLKYPQVAKKAQGAMSKGVKLISDEKRFNEVVSSISKTRNFVQDIKDYIRTQKYRDYIPESKNRNKFILQSMIPGLMNDYKILIFGSKYFIFSRPVRKNDFRASGSGSKNYSFGTSCKFPSGIFDFAKSIYDKLNIPHLSIDIAFNGEKFYLIEFQGVHFGTVGVAKSDVYFINQNNNWITVKKNESLEKIYSDAIIDYIGLH